MKQGNTTMTVAEVAKLLNVHPSTVRYMLEKNLVEWGICIPTKRKVYVIYRTKFEQITGIETN